MCSDDVVAFNIIIVQPKIIIVVIVFLLLSAEYHFAIFWGWNFQLCYSLLFFHVWAMIVVIIMMSLVEISISPMITVRSCKHLAALDAYIFDYIIFTGGSGGQAGRVSWLNLHNRRLECGKKHHYHQPSPHTLHNHTWYLLQAPQAAPV